MGRWVDMGGGARGLLVVKAEGSEGESGCWSESRFAGGRLFLVGLLVAFLRDIMAVFREWR
jgi:hypothetical protein